MQAMYDAIKAAGILHPDFVMAQCMQETGNLSCKKCCLRYHNLFGFYVGKNKCKKFSSSSLISAQADNLLSYSPMTTGVTPKSL